MARRSRPILYEVFGSPKVPSGEESARPPKGAAAKPTKRPAKAAPSPKARRVRAETPPGSDSPAREIRVSYELAGVLGLLVVVLGGTLYYFGLVRGRSPEPEAPLSASVSTGSQDGGAEEIWRPDPEYDEFFAVRVFTDTYDLRRGQEARDRAKANAERLWRFLESKNIPDVFVLAEESRDHGILKLYAGRAASKQSLEGLLTRIKRLEFEGRTQFGSAFVTQAKVKRNR